MKSFRILARGLLYLASAFFLVPFALAQSERILDYHSDIQVEQDGSMLVRETIRVISASYRIRHGIYRDFPTRYSDRLGNHYVIPFTPLAATMLRKNFASKITITAFAFIWGGAALRRKKKA